MREDEKNRGIAGKVRVAIRDGEYGSEQNWIIPESVPRPLLPLSIAVKGDN